MSLNTTPRTFVAGEVETAAIFNTEVRDAFTGLQAAWTNWAPVITSGGNPITLGNGTLIGGYLRIGKRIGFRMTLSVGSTTSMTAGTVSVPLPATAIAANCGVGPFMLVSPSVQGLWRIGNTTTVLNYYAAGSSTLGTVASLGITSGSILIMTGEYEAA